MSIDRAGQTIITLRERIKSQYALLENSEEQTRAVLIEPMLRAIGWDTVNPDVVRRELGMDGGFADYALLHPETKGPVIIVEAKKLGETRLEKYVPQIKGYSDGEGFGARYAVITNGNVWRVCENWLGFLAYNNVLALSITGDPVNWSAAQLAGILCPPGYDGKRRPQQSIRPNPRPVTQTNTLWDDALWR